MKKFLFPLNAIHNNGSVKLLYTMDDVYTFIRKYGVFNEHHANSISYYATHPLTGRPTIMFKRVIYDWIVRDDAGRVVKYDDIPKRTNNPHWEKYCATINHCIELGLPIPRTGCRKAGRKINHTAMKNSGAGHRNRNRALCEYERIEYGIKTPYGGVISWEGY